MAQPNQSRVPRELVGVVLAAAGLFLLVAQWSFDRYDLPLHRDPPNQPVHNLAGPIGAHLANASFFLLGLMAFFLPPALLLMSAACWWSALDHLLRRWPWLLVWFLSGSGLLHMANDWPVLRSWRTLLGAPSVGGFLGAFSYDWFFWMLGTVGATITYTTLYAASLVYLSNFQLFDWLRALPVRLRELRSRGVAPSPLEQKAEELEKRRKALQEELARAAVGADLKPVPEPRIRDLSVPQRKTEPEPPTTRSAPVPTTAGESPEPEPEPAVARRPEDADETTTPTDRPAPATVPTAGSDEVAKTQPPAPTKPVTPAPPTAPTPAPAPATTSGKPRKPKPIAVAAPPVIGNYQLPGLDLLNPPEVPARPGESREELLANARLIQQTLAQFDIPVELGDITKGPTITRYELHPAPGVKLERITALTNNLTAALKAERIHILAPVPGKSSVGVEVPNRVKTKVVIRDLLESEEWRNTRARIPLALGKDVYGQPIIADLAEMPHLLIAGSTGSGKSVCINAIIASLLYRFTPDQLRFVMIDPKVVELQQYNNLPHLVVPVVTDPKKVILALRWVVNEMEKRYQIFARVGVRNITSFNSRPRNKPLPEREPELPLKARKEKIEPSADGFAVEVDEEIVVPREEDIVIPEKLSYIVVIIDELADLMLVAPADVEMAIARITQMARAAGIHVIVATQRPSVDVITGVIKANIAARIAFQCASRVDSRTILDAMGAEKLLGKGDMLWLPPGSAKLIRAQGALITDEEIQRIVDFIAKQGKPNYDLEIHEQLSRPSSSLDENNGLNEDEELIQQCIEVIRSEQKASVSLLQRRLRLGYTRAARIMDELERRGIVGPSKGAEPRDILIDLDAPGPQTGPQPPPPRSTP
jgi:S-DNA-T family DNA segregation ATPase FtsK/SpoIIIE